MGHKALLILPLSMETISRHQLSFSLKLGIKSKF